MTKKLFIILSIIYFLFFLAFVTSVYRGGNETLALAIGALTTLTWGFVKIKYEIQGFDEEDKKPDTF